MRLRTSVRQRWIELGMSKSEFARRANNMSHQTLEAIEDDDGHELLASKKTALVQGLDDSSLFWFAGDVVALLVPSA